MKRVKQLNTIEPIRKRTSIGNSSRSRPKNKYKKRTWKKYRGQGK